MRKPRSSAASPPDTPLAEPAITSPAGQYSLASLRSLTSDLGSEARDVAAKAAAVLSGNTPPMTQHSSPARSAPDAYTPGNPDEPPVPGALLDMSRCTAAGLQGLQAQQDACASCEQP